MNTLTLQKEAQKRIVQMDRFIRKANRALLEFEVTQSKWEKTKGIGKIYTSVETLIKSVSKRTK